LRQRGQPLHGHANRITNRSFAAGKPNRRTLQLRTHGGQIVGQGRDQKRLAAEQDQTHLVTASATDEVSGNRLDRAETTD
jgi:hypothetical protein